MRVACSELYRHPGDGSKLKLVCSQANGDKVMEGRLIAENGDEFTIENGVVDFTWPRTLESKDQQTRTLYDDLAEDYEKFALIPFQTFHADEPTVRKDIADRLHLRPDSKVLELGCGAGDGSIHLASRLGSNGQLFLQELSGAFLNKAIQKLTDVEVPVEYAIANGCYLSFPDRYFDAAHHFGGLNTFSDIQRCLQEMARVVKPGGKVVIGDEGMGSWLRDTEFGRIMMNSNPLLRCLPPLECLPVTATEVKVEWIMMGAFYLIEFTVAEAEPKANYHIPIPSRRGGTHWSRYYGNLEGVTDEAKKLAEEASKQSGKSMHQWLSDVVIAAARGGISS